MKTILFLFAAPLVIALVSCSSVDSQTTISLSGVIPTNQDFGVQTINPSLDTAKKQLGWLWLPSFIPEGYTLAQFSITDNRRASWIYSHPPTFETRLLIEAFSSPADMSLPTGVVEDVRVKGQKAYLVRGSYAQINGPRTWREDLALNLWFNLDGWVVLISGERTKNWTADELIRIAESMQPY